MVSRTSVAHACIWDRVAAAILDLTLLKPGAGEPLNWGDFGSSVGSFTSAGRRPRTEAGEMPQKTLSAGAIYTSLMHPQIRHGRPGNRPICGMTLEPLAATTEKGPNIELRGRLGNVAEFHVSRRKCASAPKAVFLNMSDRP